MTPGRQGTEDPAAHARLHVFDIVIVDEPAQRRPPPLACRLRLWHRWSQFWVDGRTTYVACSRCGRMPSPALFGPPVP